MSKYNNPAITIIDRAYKEYEDVMIRKDYARLESIKHRLLLGLVRGIADGSISTAQTSCRKGLQVYREINESYRLVTKTKR